MEAAADQDLLCANQNLQVTAVLLLRLMNKMRPETAAQHGGLQQYELKVAVTHQLQDRSRQASDANV